MADFYVLNYFIEGKEVLGRVTISKSARGFDLRNNIHGAGSPSFWNGAIVMELVLLKDLRADHNVQMNVTRHVDEIWPDQPNERHLHICVRLPGVVPQKRYVPQQGDVHSQFKHARIATEPPSSLAKSQAYSKPSAGFPSEDLGRPPRTRPSNTTNPSPILGFWSLFRRHGRCHDVPGLADIKVAELQMAVDALATEMTRFFENESPRREKGLEHLNDIFSARWGTQTWP
ncbi:hypothetical protein EDB89DRAFT_165731 [Lactarius sanguifluus]|nr:hypothetical protein EDB89DRAFT_165731 [Lactarius sanguifluus]